MTDKLDRFIEGLKEYNLTYEEIVASGWNYCGGDYNDKLNYYKLRFPNEKLLPHADECVCGHYIEKNGYICNKKQTEFLVLGSCCIKRFIGGRTCEKCGDKHKRHTINICKWCENNRIFCQVKNKYRYKKFIRCDGIDSGGYKCKEKLVKSWKTKCKDCWMSDKVDINYE